MKEKIMIIGGDKRNFYLTKELCSKGYDACWYACENYNCNSCTFISREPYEKAIEAYDIIVLPLPLTRDLKHLNTPFSESKIKIEELREIIRDKRIFSPDNTTGNSTNYFSAKEVVIANARLTAVGLLKEMLSCTGYDIMNKTALVTGFGNVGKAVAKILDNNGIGVTVCARSKEQRIFAQIYGYNAYNIEESAKKISDFDFVVNTVPFELFDSETVIKSKKSCIFFELANGLPKETCSNHSTYINCKGMPGKHTPETAGKVIADFITEKLRE